MDSVSHLKWLTVIRPHLCKNICIYIVGDRHGSCHGVGHLNDTFKCLYHLNIIIIYVGLFHYGNIFSGVEDHFVPVDTDSVIHNMRIELVYNYKWCTVHEYNFSQGAP